MRVGVDLDNVTVEFQPHWVELYNTWFDREVDHAKLTTWNAIVTETHFGSNREFFEWFKRADGWATLPWERGAPGGIDALLAAGHQIVFVTSRYGPAIQPTEFWFARSPWGQDHHVSLRHGLVDKSVVPCSVYLDDAPHILKDLRAAGRKVIVFDKPWNRSLKINAPRAKSWDEVLAIVEEMSS